ncbi:MAG: outer membrane protein assembly factor BamD [Deltaproteobacteria bacterium]|nr:outer membrane protein assembly factor BamD [Deltaproteobacteria bacterium]
MKYKLILPVVAMLLFSGCALFLDNKTDEKTAQELVNDGMEAFNNQRYRSAIESFDKLKDGYPFSKYAILAELKIADAHFYLREYEAAITAYESFENLHPRNEATPYVIFQRGMSYIEQLETIDRDQTSAKKAIETFNRLKKTYPASEYTAQAENYIRMSLKNLAGHEFYVGEFYFKNKHYKAAVVRFRTVVSSYPDVGLTQKALEYIARCEAELAKEEAAPEKKVSWWHLWRAPSF